MPLDYILRDVKCPPLTPFMEIITEYDLYWIGYAGGKLTKCERSWLKDVGWKLQRHSRSNKEMWVFDKVDWGKTKELRENYGKTDS